MSEVLDQMNAKVDRIVKSSAGVAGDIRLIKDQIVGGVSKDEAAALGDRLEKAAVALESLDAETPDAPPAEPPVDGGNTASSSTDNG